MFVALNLVLATLVGNGAVTPARAATTWPVACDASALTAAIAGAGSGDTLSLATNCSYDVTVADHDDTGLPLIDKFLTIEGNNATITRTGSAPFRIFEVADDAALTLVDVTLTNGDAGTAEGGAIYTGTGAVTLINSALTGNTAASGGGIYSQAGTVTLVGSTVSDNTATGVEGYGGGIASFDGDVVVSDGSVVSDNDANDDDGYGGGIAVWHGDLTFEDGTLTGNTATGARGYGGGIYNYTGNVTVTNSLLSGNVTTLFGGAINASGGVIKVTKSILSDNKTLGGPIPATNLEDSGGGGAIATLAGTLIVSESTLTGNQANGAMGLGGSIGTLFSSAAVQVTTSTLSDNTAGYAGGAIAAMFGGSITVINSTLSDNRAPTAGGAIYNGAGPTWVRSSTFYGNQAPSGSSATTGSGSVQFTASILVDDGGGNCFTENATFDDGGHNLATDDSCALTGTGSQQNVDVADLHLEALADNGGSTQTMALGLGSIAVGAVPAASCPVATDQRGVVRPQGGDCDAGAYEFELLAASVTLDPATRTPVMVDRRGRAATLDLRSAVTVTDGTPELARPVTYTLTPLGGGTSLTCADSTGAGVNGLTLTSTCTLANVPAGRYTLVASAGGFYQGSATGTVIVVDPLVGMVVGGGLIQRGMLSLSAMYAGPRLVGSLNYLRFDREGLVFLRTQRLTSLVVTGQTIYLEGEATLNGRRGYRVLLTAVDTPGRQRDQVQLQVWDSSGTLVDQASFDQSPLQLGWLYRWGGR